VTGPRLPVRRPLRATLAPSTVRLLILFLETQGDDFDEWLSGARRTLTDEDAVALDEDLAVLGFVAGWQRAWLASDVGRSDLPRWDPRPRSPHELTTKQAACVLGLTVRTVRRMLERGELTGRQRNPRSWVVDRSSVELYRAGRAT
jgi:excisionase family DNA binding protein